jgi:hypothetical protein
MPFRLLDRKGERRFAHRGVICSARAGDKNSFLALHDDLDALGAIDLGKTLLIACVHRIASKLFRHNNSPWRESRLKFSEASARMRLSRRAPRKSWMYSKGPSDGNPRAFSFSGLRHAHSSPQIPRADADPNSGDGKGESY